MNAERLHDLIELEFGSPMTILSKALRSMFVAAPGKRFLGADFSAIEARINAWFAGEDYLLEEFRKFDAGVGHDQYRLAYGRAFHLPIDAVDGGREKGPHRGIGNVMILSGGYQGAVGAWLRFDSQPHKVTAIVKEQFYGSDAWRKASEQYDRARYHNDLEPEQWIAIKLVINAWREANPKIVASWYTYQDGAIAAVDSPGEVVSLLDGKVQYLVTDGFLWCKLPSGKLLAYAAPRLVETKEEYLVDADGEVFPAEEFTADEIAARVAAGCTLESSRPRTQVQFEGRNPKTQAWGTQRMYGGLQCNNIVQGTARELLRFAMHNVENAGYPIILHVHDELVVEADKAFGSVEHFESLMSILPHWLQGLPLAAKAWSDTRYVK